MIFTEQELEDIKRMIESHEIANGEKPEIVQIPAQTEAMVCGVRVKFYSGEERFTCGNGKVLHHKFLGHEYKKASK
jgi:hypothetical protein